MFKRLGTIELSHYGLLLVGGRINRRMKKKKLKKHFISKGKEVESAVPYILLRCNLRGFMSETQGTEEDEGLNDNIILQEEEANCDPR